MSRVITGVGLVKAIYRGTIALNGVTTNTATIPAVVTGNCSLRWLGVTANDGSGQTDRVFATLALTNTTTITATKGSATNNATVSYELIEYYLGVVKSVQRGTISGNGTGSISAVDTTKTILNFMGWREPGTGTFTGDASTSRMTLTNTTTVTAVENNAGGATVIAYEALEFYA